MAAAVVGVVAESVGVVVAVDATVGVGAVSVKSTRPVIG